MLDITFVLALPILADILIRYITGDAKLNVDCPPHKYATMLTQNSEYIQCVECNFIPGRL
jgi:hypothetical protein